MTDERSKQALKQCQSTSQLSITHLPRHRILCQLYRIVSPDVTPHAPYRPQSLTSSLLPAHQQAGRRLSSAAGRMSPMSALNEFRVRHHRTRVGRRRRRRRYMDACQSLSATTTWSKAHHWPARPLSQYKLCRKRTDICVTSIIQRFTSLHLR